MFYDIDGILDFILFSTLCERLALEDFLVKLCKCSTRRDLGNLRET
jgi:hypothetical protein